MSRHDRGEIEMELLQSLESLRILAQIGEIKITELLFENAVPARASGAARISKRRMRFMH